MKFYIGSGLQNCELVNSYAEKLEENGWRRTYDWTKQVGDSKTTDELTEIAEAEQKGVRDADTVIILLPAGRGAHIELGLALAQQKRVFLCAASKEAFCAENIVSFYCLPGIVRLAGTVDENIREIINF
ncbi:MAG: nucleoside 2-deoxyribosyltransferase [Lachnospiraceae bacterium]|nr:nucleoside 2-deoxyribosyltransferase [Lachnospiraceae bacterium]